MNMPIGIDSYGGKTEVWDFSPLIMGSADEHQDPEIEALIFALMCYGSRRDKSGHLAVMHPIRVYQNLSSECTVIQRVAAILHDVIEDGLSTEQETRDWFEPVLLEEQINELITLLNVLTRKKDQSYSEYIIGVAEFESAKPIKEADIDDNETRDHSGIEEDELEEMQIKYANAKAVLNG